MAFLGLIKTAKDEFDKKCKDKITYYNMDNLKDNFDFHALLDMSAGTIQFASDLVSKFRAPNKFFVCGNKVFVMGSMDNVAESLKKSDGKMDNFSTSKASVQFKKLGLYD